MVGIISSTPILDNMSDTKRGEIAQILVQLDMN
jgi:hypothetical protein